MSGFDGSGTRLLVMSEDLYKGISSELLAMCGYIRDAAHRDRIEELLSDFNEVWDFGTSVKLPLSVVISEIRRESRIILSRGKDGVDVDVSDLENP